MKVDIGEIEVNYELTEDEKNILTKCFFICISIPVIAMVPSSNG